MGFQKGIDREQTILFPLSLEEMIPKVHPLRINSSTNSKFKRYENL